MATAITKACHAGNTGSNPVLSANNTCNSMRKTIQKLMKELESLFAWSEFYRVNLRTSDHTRCQRQIDDKKKALALERQSQIK